MDPMSDLNNLWIVEDDSQEPVEFSEPTPPPCGFHSISPIQFDFKGQDVSSMDTIWTPNLGRAQPVPATPLDNPDRTASGLPFFGDEINLWSYLYMMNFPQFNM